MRGWYPSAAFLRVCGQGRSFGRRSAPSLADLCRAHGTHGRDQRHAPTAPARSPYRATRGHQVGLGGRQVELQSEATVVRRQLAEVGPQQGKLIDLYLQDHLQIAEVREGLDALNQRWAGLEERAARLGSCPLSGPPKRAEPTRSGACVVEPFRWEQRWASSSPSTRSRGQPADPIRVEGPPLRLHGVRIDAKLVAS
jgi:hypothetical protein